MINCDIMLDEFDKRLLSFFIYLEIDKDGYKTNQKVLYIRTTIISCLELVNVIFERDPIEQ